jgi:signal peptidase II
MIKLFLLLTLPLFILDQVTKSWIADKFASPFAAEGYGVEQEVISGVFWLHHAANTGMAFGLMNGSPYANHLFSLIYLAALIFVGVMAKKGLFLGWMSRLAGALIVSGILGNWTDRLFREHVSGKLFQGTFFDGYVIDFLKFDLGFWPFHPWPSFNVADSCVVCAAVLLALSTFFEKEPPKTVSANP